MTIEYIENISNAERQLKKAQVQKLNKKFLNSAKDIELAESAANQDCIIALNAYRRLREQHKRQELIKNNDEVLHFIDKKSS